MKSKEEMRTIIKQAIIESVPKDARKDFKFAGVFAEAALKALCEALPELTKKPKFSGFIDGLVMTDAPKLYNQLKQWGK